MKKILSLLAIVMLFTMAGCLNDSKSKKQTGADRLKAFAAVAETENAKRANTVLNGVYVTGATTTAGTVTVMYTFPEFIALADDASAAIYANPKAYIVYKDKYIDMVNFYNDTTVTATSFIAGTNGVKPIVDASIIPTDVVTPTGAAAKSGTAALVPVKSILQSLISGSSDFTTGTFVVRAIFNKPFTLVANDITITGSKTTVTVSAIAAGAVANSYDITIGSVKDFSAEYTITVKGVDIQEATKVFPLTSLKLDVLPALNPEITTVAQWMTKYSTTANALYMANLTTRVLATQGLKDETSRAAINCLEANGKAQYYLSAWIEDSNKNRLTSQIEVTFQTIYGSLSKTTDTFTVVDGYATNKLLAMYNTDVVLDKIKVRVTKTPEDATGYLGRESDYLQIAYLPTPTDDSSTITTTSSLSIGLKILNVENTNIADRVVISFDKSLAASTLTSGVDLFNYLNAKNFQNTLTIRDNIRNRNYKIVQWYKLPEDPSKVRAILAYNLVDAGATSANGTQMLTDNAKHSLLVTKTDYTNDTTTIPGFNMSLTVEAAASAFVEPVVGLPLGTVRSLDFQLKDDIALGYMQIYTETYRQRVLAGENPPAADKINMLVSKEEELAIYVQYSEPVAFDATAGTNASGRLNGITTRDGYANNLSNYTVNGRMLTSSVVSNVELFEENALVPTANLKDTDRRVRNTVKITLNKTIVTQLGYNFNYGPDNKPIATASAVSWPTTRQNLFATAKTGDWAAINNDRANILDSEMKDNFKVNIVSNELPPAAVIVYVGNNNSKIWHPTNVKQYDTDAAKRLSSNLEQLSTVDNFSPEQFIIKFAGDVKANTNDKNAILKLYYNNSTTLYPAAKLKITAYNWNDYTKPISEATEVADITTGFNALLVELVDWTELIPQPSMYYHNVWKNIQFTVPAGTVFITDMIMGQKVNPVINMPVTLRQDWSSPRVVTVASFDPATATQKAAYDSATDVRFDELLVPKPIVIKNATKDFLLKASEPIQISDVIIKEDETLAQKWYQKGDTAASTAKQRVGYTSQLTDENEVRFEFYNADANVTYFGRVKSNTMNTEDAMWRIIPCTTTGTATVITATESSISITDIDLAQVAPATTFIYTRADGKTKYAKWKLAIKKIADDAGNSMDTLEWNIEIERVDVYIPTTTSAITHKVAVGADSPRVVWAKFVRDVNIKVGDNFLTTSAIFVKFSHVMADNTINGVGVLSGYQLDKYRFSQKAQMIRGIYFTNNVGTGVTVTENWDGATIVLPTNEDYDNNYGVHTLDIPQLKDIYGRDLQGITELDMQPISGTDLAVAGAVNRINSLDEDNDGLTEKVSMWVNPYSNYDELNNEDTSGNSFSRVHKNYDNTTLRDIDILGGTTYITGARLYWDVNSAYAKDLLLATDPKNRTYVMTRYNELTDKTPVNDYKVDKLDIIGEFTANGGDQADVGGVTSLDFTSATTYTYDNTKRVQIWLAVAKADTTTVDASGNATVITDFRHILLSDLPVNATTVWNPAAVTATTTAAVGANTVTITGFTTPGASVTLLSGGGAAVPVTADATTGAYSLVVTGLTTNTTYTFTVQSAISGYTSTASIVATTSNVVTPAVTITSATASNITQTTATLTVAATTGATIVVTGATAGAAAEVNGTYTIALTGLTAGTVYNAITVTASKAGFTTSAAFTVTSFTTSTTPVATITSAVASGITTTSATITVVATTGATLTVAGATAGTITEVNGTYTVPVTGLTAATTYAAITVTAAKAGFTTSAAFTVTSFTTAAIPTAGITSGTVTYVQEVNLGQLTKQYTVTVALINADHVAIYQGATATGTATYSTAGAASTTNLFIPSSAAVTQITVVPVDAANVPVAGGVTKVITLPTTAGASVNM